MCNNTEENRIHFDVQSTSSVALSINQSAVSTVIGRHLKIERDVNIFKNSENQNFLRIISKMY